MRTRSRSQAPVRARMATSAAACVTGVLSLMASSQPAGPVPHAGASPFHGYAVAETTLTAGFTAISENRPDEVIHTPVYPTCTSPFSGYPVYQTEWISDGKGDWLELGTGHQCQSFQFWYAGLGAGGTWQSLWTQPVSTESAHKFWIQGTIGLNEKYFTFNIDSRQEASTFLNISAPYDQTGLESYAGQTTAPAYAMTSLQYGSGFTTTWHPWAGTHVLAGTAPMCLDVDSATDVVAGENVTCPAVAAGGNPSANEHGAGQRATGAIAVHDARQACRGAARIWRARSVLHAYQSTAAVVRGWRQTRNPRVRPVFPPLGSRAAAAPVAICYLRGSFRGIPSAPGAKTTYHQLIVLVSEPSGTAELDAATRGNAWPFGPPPATLRLSR